MARDNKKTKRAAELVNRRKAFVAHYLRCFNATESARRAGYTGTNEVLSVRGSELVRNSKVAAAIKLHLSKMQMSAEEVISRLAQQAAGDISDCIKVTRNGGFSIDLKKAKELGKLHLINEISSTQYGPKVKLYDAQKALELLGKLHKLFTEKYEHSGPEGGPLRLQVEFDQ